MHLDAATYNVVVVLADAKMTRRNGPGAAHALWEEAVLGVMETCRKSASSVCIPVAVDDKAFDNKDFTERYADGLIDEDVNQASAESETAPSSEGR